MALIEANDAEIGFDDTKIRRNFLRRVYGILFVQLAMTAATIALIKVYPQITDWFDDQQGYVKGIIIVLGCTFPMMIICGFGCYEPLRKTTPYNYMALTVFTLGIAAFLAITCSFSIIDTILYAIVMMSCVILALTIFTIQTKWDLTTASGALVTLLTILVVAITLSAITGFERNVRVTLSGLGVFVFCVFLIRSTQMMISGEHKYSIAPDEYIWGVIVLYLDVILIFAYIVQVFSDD